MSCHSQHVLVLPFPAQGHVKPMMLFSYKLAEHGVKVTFVNTEFNHKRILSAMDSRNDDDSSSMFRVGSHVDLVSIPDGLGPDEDRTDLGLLCKGILDTMPEKLEQLIQNSGSVTCVVVDGNMGWALEVVAQLGIKGAVFWPASAALFLLECSIPKLIRDGILDSDGLSTKKQIIKLSAEMPAMDSANIPWAVGDSVSKKRIINYLMRLTQGCKLTNWWLGNTTYDMESPTFKILSNFLPIGPLVANQTNTPKDILGSQFWAEDSSCLDWLNQQKPRSVVYVAFGSFTVHDQAQFQQLALGVELTNMPFLWVIRPGFISHNQNSEFDQSEYKVSDGSLGKVVSWAPQQKVLSHPSIACFVTHCGWNSTIEGLSNGVPLLCWPYFSDQFLNKSYICDVWKVGEGFEADENGIILGEEVTYKVKKVTSDEDIRKRALEMKKMMMRNIAQDGQSSNNFISFVRWLKE